MIKINKNFLEEIIQHCRQEYPKEACGILVGKIVQGSMFTVERVYKMKNTSDTPETCYFIEPEEQLKVFKEMRSLGYELVGIYHSHTGGDAYPSGRDVEMAYYTEAIYVIVSLKDFNNPEVCAFKIVDGKISEEELKVR